MLFRALTLEMRIFDSYSLKDKRSTVKGMIQQIKNKFNVSIAEVDDFDLLNKTSLGLAMVSNSNSLNEKTLQAIIQFIEDRFEVEILTIEEY